MMEVKTQAGTPNTSKLESLGQYQGMPIAINTAYTTKITTLRFTIF